MRFLLDGFLQAHYAFSNKRTFTAKSRRGRKMKKFVLYARESTKQQNFGLGFQLNAMRKYAQQNSGDIVCEYVEVCSGRGTKVELAKAVAHTKREKDCMLLVLRVDRLSRRAVEVLQLISEVQFIIVESPGLTQLTIGVMALVAQEEHRLISLRTKQALEAARLNGVVLGRNGSVLAEQNKRDADLFALNMKDTIIDYLSCGYSANKIAGLLNYNNVKSARGGRWQATQVLSIMRRLETCV